MALHRNKAGRTHDREALSRTIETWVQQRYSVEIDLYSSKKNKKIKKRPPWDMGRHKSNEWKMG